MANNSILSALFNELFDIDINESEDTSVVKTNNTKDKKSVDLYTDEDFEDTEKLNDFLNEIDKCLDEYDQLSPIAKSLVDMMTPGGWREKLIEMQDHAIDVNIAANRAKKVKEKSDTQNCGNACTKCTCDNSSNKKNYKVTELAKKYVDTEIVPLFDKEESGNLSKRQYDHLVASYTAFGDWILAQ